MSVSSKLREWFTPPEWNAGAGGGSSERSSFQSYVDDYFLFGGRYPLGVNTSYGSKSAEPISNEFGSYVDGGLKMDGVVSAIEMTRFMVFAEARFLFQQLVQGRPGDLFGTADLRILERPWVGGTTGDLLSRMLLDADLAGNSYWTRVGNELVRLRPDWVEIVLSPRMVRGEHVGYERLGYDYYEGGPQVNREPIRFLASEVCHFAPYPDPSATYKGMSWMTPVVREIQGDRMMTEHKVKFFENAATPNLVVKLPEMTVEKFNKWVELLKESHEGTANAYKTLVTGAGADVTVLGSNMQQMDFKSVQGASETRLAAAAGVHPVIVGLSEGMQGSSLNAGNYQAAKRVFIDRTIRPLWRNAAGSLETLVPPVSGSRLWYDDRDVPFLREDVQDRANIQQTASITIRNLVDAGYTPDSVKAAVANEDMTLLQHSGLFSVQLQPAGAEQPTPEPARTEVTIAEGAIRTEVHTPPVDARIMPGAVNASSSNNPTEAVEGVIERTAEKMVEAVDEVLSRRADADRVAAEAAESRAAEWVELTNRTAEALEAMRAEVAKPRKKTVKTDEIGRITAIIEEQI